jgi:hypothetical protein
MSALGRKRSLAHGRKPDVGILIQRRNFPTALRAHSGCLGSKGHVWKAVETILPMVDLIEPYDAGVPLVVSGRSAEELHLAIDIEHELKNRRTIHHMSADDACRVVFVGVASESDHQRILTGEQRSAMGRKRTLAQGQKPVVGTLAGERTSKCRLSDIPGAPLLDARGQSVIVKLDAFSDTRAPPPGARVAALSGHNGNPGEECTWRRHTRLLLAIKTPH